ncbi:hypothetical protein CLOP_g5890 [Closterium sp. NIES-67]|nr:hypothetical protein CLOP_g5890 [Closterium sp. NIES-67]
MQNEATDINKLCASVPDDLAKIIREYPEIFPDDLPSGLPHERPQDHKIELEPSAQPTVQTQWCLTQPELHELRNQLDYLLEKVFIRPSTSPFAAPILFTPKKDAGLRMCTDYRALNRVTIKLRYPIPRTDELIDNLRRARYFSKIDLRDGYHQIRVFADDCHKTAFRTRFARFRQCSTSVVAVLLLARYGDRHAALRGRVSDLPANEIITSATDRTVAAHRTTSTPMATRDDDFITGLPAGSSGNDAVLVVVDRLTKMAHFAPCRTTILAEETARLIISTIVRLHGIPAAIISDRDPKFMSKFWQDTWARYGTRLQFSSAYHPQTDGQTERTNQTMEQLILTNCPDQNKWEDALPMLEFSYNNAPSATTNHSSFYLNYRMDPIVLISTNVKSQVPRSQQFVEELQTARDKALELIRKANATARRYADLHRRDITMAIGQLILLDTKNLRLPLPTKLRPRFCGPFKLIKMVTP